MTDVAAARTPRCLTIAASDSGGGAGVQADLKAFAAAGCYGTSAIVALTAQNTVAITAVHEVPAEFITAQLLAVFDDIGVDAAKTGALLSAAAIEAAVAVLRVHRVPLVVDPVMHASTGAELLHDDALRAMRSSLIPLATVVTPNLEEARALAGADGTPAELSERIAALGAGAVLITSALSGGSERGGSAAHGDHLFDGLDHIDIPVKRVESRATHGSGCTHSATMTAELAKGRSLREAAVTAARVTATAIAGGHLDVGSGDGPVEVLQSTGASQRRLMK